jgi:hypothetical protein
MTDVSELLDVIRNGVEANRRTFTEPADDWHAPMLLLTDGENVISATVDPEVMQTIEGKDFFAEVAMPELISAHKIRSLVMLLNVWSFVPKTAEDVVLSTELGPALMPERVEQLHMVAFRADDDVEMWTNNIVRHEDAPPTLTGWEQVEGLRVEGRFYDAINAALKAVDA